MSEPVLDEIHRLALRLKDDASEAAHRDLDAAITAAKDAHRFVISQATALKPVLEEALKAVEPEVKAAAIKALEDFIMATVKSLGTAAA